MNNKTRKEDGLFFNDQNFIETNKKGFYIIELTDFKDYRIVIEKFKKYKRNKHYGSNFKFSIPIFKNVDLKQTGGIRTRKKIKKKRLSKLI